MKVLILTGGLVSGVEASILTSLRKLFQQWRASEHAWLDVKIKLVFGEFLIRKPRALSEDLWAPDLTEVLLATLLRQQGMPYVLATYGDLFDRPRHMEQLLGEADCVFASTTFLRDLSELTPLLRKLRRSHNRIVVGGPLASLLADRWEGAVDVDILAAGYGELLVPSLVDWMRSGFAALQPPPGGRIVERGPTRIVYSGVPATTDLDFLPTPDWTLSQADRGKRYRMIYYESVRGCPYRCNQQHGQGLYRGIECPCDRSLPQVRTHHGRVVDCGLSRRDPRDPGAHARFHAEPSARFLLSRSLQHARHGSSDAVGCEPGAVPTGDDEPPPYRRTLLAPPDDVLNRDRESSTVVALQPDERGNRSACRPLPSPVARLSA